MFMEICNGTYCVYIHTNKINGKMYVGQTIYGNNPKRRWGGGNGYKGCEYFYNAIQKYGWDKFEHEIIANNLTADEADNFEKLLITKLDLRNPNKGYNLESGGTKNKTLSESTKKKISESKIGKSNGPRSEETKKRISEGNKGKVLSDATKQKISGVRKECWTDEDYRRNQIEKHKWQTGEKHPWYGRNHTEETKEKIRQTSVGRILTEEAKIKLSIANSGENNPFYGKTHSEEARRRVSKSNTGAKNGRARRVIQYDSCGNFIRVWNHIREAAIELNINYSSIVACCRDRQRKAGEFIWKYYMEGDSVYAESISI